MLFRSTAVIPTHLARCKTLLPRALESVSLQTHPVDVVTIATDLHREGAGPTRNRALQTVRTDWVAFLDSDDEWETFHVEELMRWAANTGADVVYPECMVVHAELGAIPRTHPAWDEWGRPGKLFDAELLRKKSYIPVTSLVRADLARQCSFVPPGGSHYDDWGFYLDLLNLGAKFVHLPMITWTWHHGPHNTSGQPDRGDAK